VFLIAHPLFPFTVNSYNPLFHLQTQVQVVQSRSAPEIKRFNFSSNIWVALQADPDELTDDFWIAKILAVNQKQLSVHWWAS
jgi:hypothetical protein